MKVDPVLNWAERRTFWIMISAFATGNGIGNLLQGHWYGWLLLVPGLVLLAIYPAGTYIRRLMYLREVRNITAPPKKVNHE